MRIALTKALSSIIRFVETHFPIRRHEDNPAAAAAAAAGTAPAAATAFGAAPAAPAAPAAEPPLIAANVALKVALMAEIEALPLPANFLDELIDRLGGPGAVAEMTGALLICYFIAALSREDVLAMTGGLSIVFGCQWLCRREGCIARMSRRWHEAPVRAPAEASLARPFVLVTQGHVNILDHLPGQH